jgi:3-phosphoshikimate 1-carboxyvinyltransferase
MKIRGGRLKGGAVLDPNGDHRMAMAFSIAGLLTDRPTVIRHAECVDVSYPDFYEDLQSLQ